MTILLETISLPEHGTYGLNFKQTITIQIPAIQARRKVSVFVGNHIGDLLHGDTPNLAICSYGVFWRVPVILSSATHGKIGMVGTIDVDVNTGKFMMNDRIIAEIEANAQRFATRAAL